MYNVKGNIMEATSPVNNTNTLTQDIITILTLSNEIENVVDNIEQIIFGPTPQRVSLALQDEWPGGEPSAIEDRVQLIKYQLENSLKQLVGIRERL